MRTLTKEAKRQAKIVNEATKPILNALLAIHTRESLDEIWSNAINQGVILKDRNDFDQWVAEYVLDSIHDLFQEYGVETE
jgi:hypothetical protein